jgi:hypothetical protein
MSDTHAETAAPRPDAPTAGPVPGAPPLTNPNPGHPGGPGAEPTQEPARRNPLRGSPRIGKSLAIAAALFLVLALLAAVL